MPDFSARAARKVWGHAEVMGPLWSCSGAGRVGLTRGSPTRSDLPNLRQRQLIYLTLRVASSSVVVQFTFDETCTGRSAGRDAEKALQVIERVIRTLTKLNCGVHPHKCVALRYVCLQCRVLTRLKLLLDVLVLGSMMKPEEQSMV